MTKSFLNQSTESNSLLYFDFVPSILTTSFTQFICVKRRLSNKSFLQSYLIKTKQINTRRTYQVLRLIVEREIVKNIYS